MNLDVAAELCRRFEGFRSQPYLCPAGVATIGYGSTRYADGRAVQLTDPPISQEAAERLLQLTLSQEFLPGVLRACPVLVAHPARCNAIVDWAYNLGVGRLQTSTLRRVVNAQDWAGAREQLMRWTRASGRELPGLVRRRQAEAALL